MDEEEKRSLSKPTRHTPKVGLLNANCIVSRIYKLMSRQNHTVVHRQRKISNELSMELLDQRPPIWIQGLMMTEPVIFGKVRSMPIK